MKYQKLLRFGAIVLLATCGVLTTIHNASAFSWGDLLNFGASRAINFQIHYFNYQKYYMGETDWFRETYVDSNGLRVTKGYIYVIIDKDGKAHRIKDDNGQDIRMPGPSTREERDLRKIEEVCRLARKAAEDYEKFQYPSIGEDADDSSFDLGTEFEFQDSELEQPK